VIDAVANILGMTPAQVRSELASGTPLRRLAREHGLTLRRLRREVRAQLRP
jgi:hypothetical protein